MRRQTEKTAHSVDGGVARGGLIVDDGVALLRHALEVDAVFQNADAAFAAAEEEVLASDFDDEDLTAFADGGGLQHFHGIDAVFALAPSGEGEGKQREDDEGHHGFGEFTALQGGGEGEGARRGVAGRLRRRRSGHRGRGFAGSGGLCRRRCTGPNGGGEGGVGGGVVEREQCRQFARFLFAAFVFASAAFAALVADEVVVHRRLQGGVGRLFACFFRGAARRRR